MFQVFVFRDGEFLGMEMVAQSTFEVGRDPHCAVCIQDDQASRRHFRVGVVGSDFVITDLASGNGTFVDGERLKAPRTISARNDVRVGRHVLKFKLLLTASAAASAPRSSVVYNVTATQQAKRSRSRPALQWQKWKNENARSPIRDNTATALIERVIARFADDPAGGLALGSRTDDALNELLGQIELPRSDADYVEFFQKTGKYLWHIMEDQHPVALKRVRAALDNSNVSERIRLVITEGESLSLPWEYLCVKDGRQNDIPLACDPRVSIVRTFRGEEHVGDETRVNVRDVTSPLNILAAAVEPEEDLLRRDPVPTSIPDLVKGFLHDLPAGRATLLASTRDLTPDHIRTSLDASSTTNAGKFNTLHFAMHGHADKASSTRLVFASDGQARPETPEVLFRKVGGYEHVELLSFMSCSSASFSSVAGVPVSTARLFIEGKYTPWLVAMSSLVNRHVAADFFRHLYRHLSNSTDIEAAIAMARGDLLKSGGANAWAFGTVATYVLAADSEGIRFAQRATIPSGPSRLDRPTTPSSSPSPFPTPTSLVAVPPSSAAPTLSAPVPEPPVNLPAQGGRGLIPSHSQSAPARPAPPLSPLVQPAPPSEKQLPSTLLRSTVPSPRAPPPLPVAPPKVAPRTGDDRSHIAVTQPAETPAPASSETPSKLNIFFAKELAKNAAIAALAVVVVGTGVGLAKPEIICELTPVEPPEPLLSICVAAFNPRPFCPGDTCYCLGELEANDDETQCVAPHVETQRAVEPNADTHTTPAVVRPSPDDVVDACLSLDVKTKSGAPQYLPLSPGECRALAFHFQGNETLLSADIKPFLFRRWCVDRFPKAFVSDCQKMVSGPRCPIGRPPPETCASWAKWIGGALASREGEIDSVRTCVTIGAELQAEALRESYCETWAPEEGVSLASETDCAKFIAQCYRKPEAPPAPP